MINIKYKNRLYLAYYYVIFSLAIIYLSIFLSIYSVISDFYNACLLFHFMNELYSLTFPLLMGVQIVVIFSPCVYHTFVRLFFQIKFYKQKCSVNRHKHFKYQNLFPNCSLDGLTNYTPTNSVLKYPFSCAIQI